MAIAVLTDTAVVSEIEEAVLDGRRRYGGGGSHGRLQHKGSGDADGSLERATRAETKAALARAETKAAEAEADRSRDREAADRARQQEREEWQVEKRSLEDQVVDIERDRNQTRTRADDTDKRIETMEIQLQNDEKRRKRNHRIAAGLLIIAAGLALALVSSLILFTNPWAIGGGVFGGVALVLLGIRVAVGKQWGGEFVTWASLLTAITGVVVAIIIDLH